MLTCSRMHYRQHAQLASAENLTTLSILMVSFIKKKSAKSGKPVLQRDPRSFKNLIF
jgi:hypothetical protein